MIERTRTNQQRIGVRYFRGLRSQVGYLHRMLERSRCFLGQEMEQVRIDIRQLDQRDGRDEMEDFLKQIDQTVTTDDEQSADEEIEVVPCHDSCEDAGLGKRDGRISD